MSLAPNELTAIALVVMSTVFILCQDEIEEWGGWCREVISAAWSSTVGAWFARRRFVGNFNERRHKLFRIGHPDEHSRGIMVMRRDVNAGWWS